MLSTLKLLLPALMPSWNFFDVIADSPRVEYARLMAFNQNPEDWQEFRPRPAQLSPAAMVWRLLWNARWNETLFVAACAERLLAAPTAHSEDEIFKRVAADLVDAAGGEGDWLRFRIVLLREEGHAILRETAFVSAPRRLDTVNIQ